jgi:ribosomal protein S18 acetylase RimI-like enzyme
MVRLLTKHRFKVADLDLPEVKNFYCGPNRWDQDVADWIKSPDGVLQDIQTYGTEVWLHRTMEGDLVGFSSLGENRWSIPMPKGEKRLISVIPFIGVQEHFQGEPADAERDDKFAYQILDELIEYAAEKTAERADLFSRIGLSVDKENKRAIKFYTNRDFADTGANRKDKETQVVYCRMILNIESLVAPLR